MPTILVVDDDQHIRDVVVFSLKKHDFLTLEAATGLQAIALFEEHKPDLIILDVMMPEMDGTEVCRTIRKSSVVPIIFLTAMDEEVDVIVGLELGGDDYIFKPFSPRHLIARVRAVLRRSLQFPVLSQGQSQINNSVFKCGFLVIDSEKFKVYWNDNELVFTVTEISLLQVLASRPGKVFTRNELMERAYDNIVVSDRTIDSHIRRLRSKFNAVGADPIETVHGAGYKLGNCES